MWPYLLSTHNTACAPVSWPPWVASWLISSKMTHMSYRAASRSLGHPAGLRDLYPGLSQRSLINLPQDHLLARPDKWLWLGAVCASLIKWSLSGLKHCFPEDFKWAVNRFPGMQITDSVNWPLRVTLQNSPSGSSRGPYRASRHGGPRVQLCRWLPKVASQGHPAFGPHKPASSGSPRVALQTGLGEDLVQMATQTAFWERDVYKTRLLSATLYSLRS